MKKNKNNKNVKTIFKLHRKKSYEILVTKNLKENPKTRSHKKVLIKNNERNSLSVKKLIFINKTRFFFIKISFISKTFNLK